MLKRCSNNSIAKREWSDFIKGQHTQIDICQKTESQWANEKTFSSKVQINTMVSYHLVPPRIASGRKIKDTTC